MRPRTRCLLAGTLLLAVLHSAGGVYARPGQGLRPPVLAEIELDGKLEEAWDGGVQIPMPQVTVPTLAGTEAKLVPHARLAVAGGRLLVAVRVEEPAGTGIGLRLMIAPEGTATAARAVALDYRPAELRAPRYRVIGPRGTGRAIYRFQGAVDWGLAAGESAASSKPFWSLEAGVPIRDLVGTDARKPLRIAITVSTRTPNVLATWPAGAAWHGPGAWNPLSPPEGGWPLEVQVDQERITAEDEADARAQAAWVRYLQGAATPLLPTAPREELLAAVRADLLAPLDDLLEHRPDLLVPVLCVKGDVYHRLGLDEQAAETYRKAVEAGRGWREASYGLYVKVRGPGWASGDIGGPTDFAGARAALRAAAALEVSSDPLAEVGRRLGRAMLDYREGKFERAIPVLEELAKRFPFDAFLESHMRMAYRGRRSAGEERQFIARDAKAALPHAVVTTSRGPFTIELFQGDVGNAVSNFVWLASHGFYDGVAVHHTVPFFALQTGDPYSKAGAAHPELVGTGGPGYAIRTEGGRRRALRGYVAFANAGPDTEGSQFLVFTGTAVHLQGEVTVFGRVLAGMDVVDALRVGDRIVSVKPEGLEEGRDYRPNDVSGDPAPEPTSQR